ncbi:MAG: hypothetical protein ACI4J2_08950 [Ruminococcus sp.]
MKFCENCGYRNSDEAASCAGCGQKLDAANGISVSSDGMEGLKDFQNNDESVHSSVRTNSFIQPSKTMFDNCAVEQPPTSIEDCTKQDAVTINLWTWARRLELLGQILLALIIIGGVIISWADSYIITDVVHSEYEREFSFSLFFVNIFHYTIYALIEYCSYHVIALLVGSLARIVQSTHTTARIAEFEARNKNK